MDSWLLEHLVCPRDHKPLHVRDEHLWCAAGHRYPVIDGIPVMLLAEVEQTHHAAAASLAQTALGQPAPTRGPAGIDPYVQRAVAGTNGMLYHGLIDRLPRYPIPELRLPAGQGRVLLDIGCGWGRWCMAAARQGYNPVGIDPSLEAVAAARRVSHQLGLPARFVVGDARFLPFATASFDVAFSYSVLQHMSDENVEQVLAQVARVLRIDGYSLIQMAHTFGLRCLYHQARRGFQRPQRFEVRYRTLRTLQSMFTRLIGPSTLSVDGYFGLGIQPDDADLLPAHFRAVVRFSERLRIQSERRPHLIAVADSVYVHSINNTLRRSKALARGSA